MYKMNFIKYIFLFTTLLSLGACSDELDLNPRQSLSTGEALADLDGLETALYGAYDGLQSINYYGRNFIVIPDIYILY